MKTAPRGMSLLEIMVVITLIGLVTAVVGVAVFTAADRARRDIARQQAYDIASAVQQWRLVKGAMPGALAVLTEPPPAMESVPTDPWGNAYAYVHPGTKNTRSFDIVSNGPDGIAGTDDDVGNWAAD